VTAGTDRRTSSIYNGSNGRITRRAMKAMPEYHCFFLDAAGQVAATLTIRCGTDDEAQSLTGKMLAVSDHVGVEIWIGGRSLYRSRKPGFYPGTFE
jgi:hypothetical protein